MHRFIFEDFNTILPDCKLDFACPLQYHDAVIDHPYINKVIDHKTVNENDYGVVYNTSKICNIYELKMKGECKKHRAEIWAEHCGVKLRQFPSMHFNISPEEKQLAKKYFSPNGKPIFLISSISAMASKNLTYEQINPVINKLLPHFDVYFVHSSEIKNFNIKTLIANNIREYLAIIDAADYILGVDSSVFHCAGGMNKPCLGIYSWADGYVYSKYYPNSTIVQYHRKKYGDEWSCCPCYEFTNCSIEKDQRVLVKPCMSKITSEMIWNGLINHDKFLNFLNCSQ